MPPLSRTDGVAQSHADGNRLLRVRDAVAPQIASLVRRLASLDQQRRSGPAEARRPRHLFSLRPRQDVVAIPNTYGDLNNSPAPGTVVGIVLGSVAGFLFIIWLFYLCFNTRGGASIVAEEEIVVRSRRGSRSSRRAETIEVSRSSSSSRSRSPRPRRSPVRETRTERIIVEERRTAPVVDRDDDIVEVIEERDGPRRNRSSRNRPTSGFRTVDPDRFAGGNAPVQEVFNARKSSRRTSGRR
ncbi:MAG: hypothetical protein M1832_001032 [Thelocarpon impressellum]|nr:MAG: hypothetical protein M1832_001032 [Thelocarpon impressellum]